MSKSPKRSRSSPAARTPTFIFFVEEVWRFPTGDEFAVSGRMVEGYFPGACAGHARLSEGPTIAVRILGLAKARTSRLERAVTLRVSVAPGDEHRLRGALLMGFQSQEGTRAKDE